MDPESKKKVEANQNLTHKSIQETLDILRGATMIVYPMGLPPHEPIKLELENKEDLSGTQASMDVVDPNLAQLWFSGKEILRGKKMRDFIGNNEKTKVIVKISQVGKGAPGREPIMTEEERKQMMLNEYRRQEELKKLEVDDDDEYHNAPWADGSNLKRSFQGLSNISWRPK